MYTLSVNNVNDAYNLGLPLIRRCGVLQPSRAGEVIVLDRPLTVCYEKPTQRVLFAPIRDANPFFHLFESLWMLAGRNDARWLDRFIHDFSSRFAEDDGYQHGAYGHRWRKHFDLEGGGHPSLPDQLNTVVERLKHDPTDRRCVIAMWDPTADLGADKRDLPCNTHIYLRIRQEPDAFGDAAYGSWFHSYLDITVCCRSNDFVWGMTGANAVHFSMLQEYLAGRIGVGVGRYYQIANNAHLYLNTPNVEIEDFTEPYPLQRALGLDWIVWDRDLASFMAWTETGDPCGNPEEYPRNPWFSNTAQPLWFVHDLWRKGKRQAAYNFLVQATYISGDWRAACIAWMKRRIDRQIQKEGQEYAR